jgi:predicted PurR-regulated permease PerM
MSWRYLIVAAAIAVTVWALSHVMLVVLPLLIALMLCTALVPVARRLEAWRLPNSAAALITVVGALLLVVAIMGIVVPQFTTHVVALGEDIEAGFATALGLANEYLGISDKQAQDLLDRGQEQLQDRAGSIGGGLLAGAVAFGEFVTGSILTLVMTFFIVKDRRRLREWFLARIPDRRRGEFVAVGRRAWMTLGGYFRGQAIIAAVDAIGIAIGLAVIGVPLVAPLALLTFIGGFFPIVGAVAAGMVAVLVALVDGGLTDALLVVGVVIAVQQIEGNVLQPVVMGRAVPLHPLVILIVITAGAVLGGIVGAFLSVPIAGVLAAVGNELRLRHEAALDPAAMAAPQGPATEAEAT